MTTMLLDRVAAYADAVRAHLSDLGPEAAEDLTDGLEADLAEELVERSAGTGPSDDGSALLDLDRVFGPAVEYALELRSAAGLAPVPSRPAGRRLLREAARATWQRWASRSRALAARIETLPGGGWLVETLPLLRPAWWLLRGWVWSVLLLSMASGTIVGGPLSPYVPEGFIPWLLLIAAVVVSIEYGRGRLTQRRVALPLSIGHVLAVLAVLPVLASASAAATQVRYVSSDPYESADPWASGVVAPQDGVVVDGMYVSNLYVFDAEGNALHDVQIVDDRGRPVRTITDGSNSEWSLPGVIEAWVFGSTPDEFGRELWNVYPLAGAPVDDWTWDEDERTLLTGSTLRQPPAPFDKAPALLAAAAAEAQPGVEGTAVPEESASPEETTEPSAPGDQTETPDDQTEAPGGRTGEATTATSASGSS